MNEDVHIALATDNEYIRQTCITIYSVLCQSNSSVLYFFHILYNGNDISLLKKDVQFISDGYSNTVIDIIDVSDIISDNTIVGHITSTTYARLFLPELLLEVTKCVYLDSDVIVNSDIKELYDVNIQNEYIAGVKSPAFHKFNYIEQSEYTMKTGIKSMVMYINAGVILMNLFLLRTIDFSRRAISLLESKNLPLRDQDVINNLCYGKIKLLHPKYNVTHSLMDKLEPPLWAFSEEELLEARNNPRIVHFTTSAKPWNMPEIEFAELWWRVCMHTPLFFSFVNDSKKELALSYILSDMDLWKTRCYTEEWIGILRRQTNINVFGYGNKGTKIIDYLLDNNINIKQILVTKQGSNNKRKHRGVPICEYKHNLGINDTVLLAVSRSTQLEIKDMLRKDGLIYIYLMV